MSQNRSQFICHEGTKARSCTMNKNMLVGPLLHYFLSSQSRFRISLCHKGMKARSNTKNMNPGRTHTAQFYLMAYQIQDLLLNFLFGVINILQAGAPFRSSIDRQHQKYHPCATSQRCSAANGTAPALGSEGGSGGWALRVSVQSAKLMSMRKYFAFVFILPEY